LGRYAKINVGYDRAKSKMSTYKSAEFMTGIVSHRLNRFLHCDLWSSVEMTDSRTLKRIYFGLIRSQILGAELLTLLYERVFRIGEHIQFIDWLRVAVLAP
jgi:hypothetical protein